MSVQAFLQEFATGLGATATLLGGGIYVLKRQEAIPALGVAESAKPDDGFLCFDFHLVAPRPFVITRVDLIEPDHARLTPEIQLRGSMGGVISAPDAGGARQWRGSTTGLRLFATNLRKGDDVALKVRTTYDVIPAPWRTVTIFHPDFGQM